MAGHCVTLLHTSDVHRATFDSLRDAIAPDVSLTHIVRPDFLVRAQGSIDHLLTKEVALVVQSAPAPVLCTCTSIGKAAGKAGAIRIDQPMMQAAARTRKPVLMVYCLKSTRAPSMELLNDAIGAEGSGAPVQTLFAGQYWPLFQSGRTKDFCAGITQAVIAALNEQENIGCVVLAQASMAGAAPHLAAVNVPVLTSPESALRAALLSG